MVSPRRQDYEIVQIMKEDGDLIADNKARKIGSHLFSDRLGGLALPSRQPTNTYEHRELHRRPIKRSSIHLETADPVSPERDADFVLSQAPAMWDAARLGLEVEDEQTTTDRALKWIAGIATTLLAIGAALYLVYVNEEKRELNLQRENEAAQREAIAPPVEPVELVPDEAVASPQENDAVIPAPSSVDTFYGDDEREGQRLRPNQDSNPRPAEPANEVNPILPPPPRLIDPPLTERE